MNSPIRSEINRLIQNLPENKLESILNYLRKVEKTSKENVQTASLVSKIIDEDAYLLKRL